MFYNYPAHCLIICVWSVTVFALPKVYLFIYLKFSTDI